MKVELGNVYFKFKKHVEGKDVIEEAYFTACKRFDRDHPLSIDALYSLAITNLQTKNHDAAIEQLKEVLDWRRTYLGETDEKTANTCYYLGKAYYSAEYYDQAINVLENAKGLIQQLINDAQNAYENPISLEDMQKSIYAMLAEAHLQLKSYKEAYECQKKVCMYEDMLDPFSDESEEASKKLKSIRDLISK
jgi:tetratricopeptide (TPR) repeat protein